MEEAEKRRSGIELFHASEVIPILTKSISDPMRFVTKSREEFYLNLRIKFYSGLVDSRFQRVVSSNLKFPGTRGLLRSELPDIQ